ncbi:MAG: hypothetical protein HY716_16170 [Planctomycetes bacterium]|nr:hypothetical protein [Planctomycetota bacterium]
MKTQPNEPLERQLIRIVSERRENSFATRRKRFYELRAMGRAIKFRFGLQKWDHLGRKHVKFLVDQWKSSGLEPRSIEQKLTHLRWFLKAIGKPNLLPRTNAELGLAPGPRYTRQGKAVSDAKFNEVFNAVGDPRIQALCRTPDYAELGIIAAALWRSAWTI